MNAETIRALSKHLKRIEDRSVRYRQGIISDVSPLSVALGGSDVPYTNVATLDSTLVVGESVAVLTFGNDLLVLGQLGGNIRCGQTTLEFTAAALSANRAIAHGMGSAPISVTATADGVGNGGSINVSTNGLNATNINLVGRTTDDVSITASVPVHWIAIW